MKGKEEEMKVLKGRREGETGSHLHPSMSLERSSGHSEWLHWASASSPEVMTDPMSPTNSISANKSIRKERENAEI
jgi:hypothetical protein